MVIPWRGGPFEAGSKCAFSAQKYLEKKEMNPVKGTRLSRHPLYLLDFPDRGVRFRKRASLSAYPVAFTDSTGAQSSSRISPKGWFRWCRQ